ncbi:MAG TPA: hypothetical protein VL381_06105, partial [Rhodocyclaceae bacterium]|nr:hypothetical protein [Rhodocyclaceae bacterium]
IAAGVLGLVYGGFNYTKDKEVAKLGSLEFTVKSEETVSVPLWLSVGAIVAGTLALVVGGKRG